MSDLIATNEMDSPVGLEATHPASSDAKPSIEDMAAHDYQKLLPLFFQETEYLNKKQLNRVLKALVEYPFENNSPTFSFKSEQKAFYLGMQIFDCGFVMKRYVLDEIQRKGGMQQVMEDTKVLKQETSKETTQDASSSKTKEENNG